MAVSSGPDIVDSGLVLALDAADRNSFDDDENLALNSEAINSWANNGNAISISANSQIAPDGTLTADVLSQTAVTGASRWVSSMSRTYTAGVTYTLSIWLKKISGTDAQPTINLWVNGGTNQSVGAITTEWVRYSKSFTPASTISSSTFTGLNTGWSDTGVANNFTFAAWGFQVETSSLASPYYPTTSTAKNRGSTLIDLTGRGNTGTLTNGPTYSSANGGSLVFDGTNDYVSIPLSTSLNKTQGTMNFWVYPTRYNGSNGYFVNRDDSTANAVDWLWIGAWSGTFYFRLGSGSDCCSNDLTFSNVSSVIPLNSWTNICVTWVSNGTSAIYKNGTLYTSRSIGNVPSTNPSLTGRIGLGHGGNGDEYFAGRMSNTSIYNRALTAAEIQQNFNATRSRFGI